LDSIALRVKFPTKAVSSHRTPKARKKTKAKQISFS
jgi:hypothetical protein